jgi:hypothetical protein
MRLIDQAVTSLARRPGASKKIGGRSRPSIPDHENRKTPISKPAANAQRPNVQAETTRTRLRRSCGISWVRSVIAPPAIRENRQSLLTRHPPRFTCPKEGNCRSREPCPKEMHRRPPGPRLGPGRRRLQHQAAAVVILPRLLQAAHERRKPPFRRRRTADYALC